jgi:hypothetical protein
MSTLRRSPTLASVTDEIVDLAAAVPFVELAREELLGESGR